jgi:uncharacterized repeat protein (TIGR03803 family)
VFALNTDGTGFTNLHSFTAFLSNTNSDGASPQAGLIVSGNTLYGTAVQGGSSAHGTLFAVKTDGSGFTNLHSFAGGDGATPNGLILSANTLYGTAAGGGSFGNGTVFSLSLLLPQLTMAISGPYVILTWPANDPAVYSSGFRVQATLDPLPFTPETVWTDFAVPPIVINGQYSITVLDGIFKTQRLYRLKSF